ncbi:MAG TPA: cupin domain-containing protein [Acidimicrobiales bacterium]
MSGTTTTNHTSPFRLRGFPLLSAGNTFNFVAAAPGLWAHVKVYAEGGENGVHTHFDEDHLFVVLAGEATFVDAEGDETVVGALEGMMVPRGAAYAFRSSSDGNNLVMLRVGAPVDPALADWDDVNPEAGIPNGILQRSTPQGAPAPGRDPANKTGAVRGVPIPGRFFGE